MFSRKMLVIAGVTGLLIVSIVSLTVTSRRSTYPVSGGSAGIFVVAPFQDILTSSARSLRDVWRHYFFLVSTAQQNGRLKQQVRRLEAENKQFSEIARSNKRLRELLNFHEALDMKTFAAEVVARDPSGWFETVIIDKGGTDGVTRSMPVVVPEGIVGQVVDVSPYYSKVLLIIDPNSAVDALCQRTRARGVVKGGAGGRCDYKYVLRKNDVRIGDVVISSGLDQIYPKGLRVGHVSGVIKRNAGIFQTVEVEPFVNFDKLEEVLVVLNATQYEFPKTNGQKNPGR
ncbi:MAG: rod shape-determining protein MreC [Thermodesulfobacteriota bacterium]|nr:rod shape-determining protein MreC [Thermodesulfobacteriota bacterium]